MQMPVVTRDVGEQTEWATWHLCSPSQPRRGTLGTVPEPVWPSESSPQGWGWGVGACSARGDHRRGLRASHSPSQRLGTDAPRFLANHESECP